MPKRWIFTGGIELGAPDFFGNFTGPFWAFLRLHSGESLSAPLLMKRASFAGISDALPNDRSEWEPSVAEADSAWFL